MSAGLHQFGSEGLRELVIRERLRILLAVHLHHLEFGVEALRLRERMQAETRAELESVHSETLHSAKDNLAQAAELARAEVASAVPRRHRDELHVEDVAGLQCACFRVIDQASDLRFAVGIKVEPLV